MTKVPTIWLPERDAMLLRLWSDGRNLEEIRDAFAASGLDLTVMAVRSRVAVLRVRGAPLARRKSRLAWPPEPEARLKQLLADGILYEQIAETISAEFPTLKLSRGAISGKVGRMGLGCGRRPPAPRPAPPPSTPQAEPKRVVEMKRPQSPKGVMILPPLKGGDGLGAAAAKANGAARANPPEFVALTARKFEPLSGCKPVPFGSRGCKWPVGGEGADMLQCGQDRDGERPYCAVHCDAAYQPFKPGAAKTGAQLARQLRRWAA